MKQTEQILKRTSYEDQKLWLRKIYLNTIKELYEDENYLMIEVFVWNYQILIERLKGKDPQRQFKKLPQWQSIGRRLLDAGPSPSSKRFYKLIRETYPKTPSVDDKVAADWFEKQLK